MLLVCNGSSFLRIIINLELFLHVFLLLFQCLFVWDLDKVFIQFDIFLSLFTIINVFKNALKYVFTVTLSGFSFNHDILGIPFFGGDFMFLLFFFLLVFFFMKNVLFVCFFTSSMISWKFMVEKVYINQYFEKSCLSRNECNHDIIQYTFFCLFLFCKKDFGDHLKTICYFKIGCNHDII